MYQVHFKQANGRMFALPVYGSKETIWDRLAIHMHYCTFKTWSKAIGFDQRSNKARFHLVEVAQ
jgi:hypothetical protein